MTASVTARSLPAAMPSPETAVWYLGPFPVRAYALCIMAGILAAVVIASWRMRSRGGTGQEVYDVAGWAIVLGILGGRIYHVVSSPRAYFGEDGNPLAALRIWEGGLGIWGAVALGAVGVWIGCRRHGHSFAELADAIAPGLLVAQAIGRWGNWFNNELYGGPSSAPWAVVIHEWDPGAGRALRDPETGQALVEGTFQPTFLYESLWCLVLAVGLLVLDRRVDLARGRLFALYVMGYTLGRFFVELQRTDPAEQVLGQRLNVWVAVVVFLLGAALFAALGQRRGRPGAGPGDGAGEVPERAASATG